MLQAKIYNVKILEPLATDSTLILRLSTRLSCKLPAKEGGTIYIPAGEYACYSIRLANQIHLYLEQGAIARPAFPTAEQGYDKAEPNPHNSFQDFGHSHWKNSLYLGN